MTNGKTDKAQKPAPNATGGEERRPASVANHQSRSDNSVLRVRIRRFDDLF